MRVVLRENTPHDLRAHLGHHRTFTIAYLGWPGVKNGLLETAEKEGFDVLVTGDLSFGYQQNLTGRRIAVVSLSAIGWGIIEPHVHRTVAAIDAAEAGTFVGVDCGTFVRRKRKDI